MREEPSFVQSLKESFGKRSEESSPFIGSMDETTFHMRRDIHYRNSFLPQVHGSVKSLPTGARVLVTMYLHPVVAVFMLFWLGAVGVGAVAVIASQSGGAQPVLILTGMFMFGIALTAGGFYPEAVKARRLLEQGIARGT
jgi:hypothetical protein